MKHSELIPRFVKFMPEVKEEGVLYISLEYGTAIHKCACGCGELTVTPLNPDWWSLEIRNNKVTLRPSIGNFRMPCKSHYWITENKVVPA